ncbi:MAG: hypothetical protein WC175_06305 [Candidatus Dojkabacteria bacterium]
MLKRVSVDFLNYDEEERVFWQNANVFGFGPGGFPDTLMVEHPESSTIYSRILRDEDPNGEYNTVIYEFYDTNDSQFVGTEVHLYNK